MSENRTAENVYLSIVIPAYNEEKRISTTLKRIRDFLATQPYSAEIILVDDGSTDKTIQVATALNIESLKIVKNERNLGKGAATRNGILSARGELILFSDADLSTPIEEVNKLIQAINEGYDVAIGSRALPESEIIIHQPFYRETMGRVFNLFVRMLVLKGIKDSQCGFKLFRAEVAKKVFAEQQLSGFAFDVEILLLARRAGYRIKEVPVKWINSPASRVSPTRDAIKMFTDLIKLRRLYKKRY
ncbi:glycosyltransferase family 2 protein [Candidatus Sumerlaeota bacterium]|nr:glycosyltransferase family 2 protein [Candidatus Sumerlaeota bacterium]